ncbi:MAG TPA: hypothetical protein VFS15_13480, partial [Kofleriaceae bacterium]|nr:hypothetical protein [Kofleriaceae bacterium]
MADEVFEIALQVSGEGSGARAFENLRLRELEAKQEAQRLAAELRKLKQSGEATDAQIEETARAMIRAKQAASQYAAEARRLQAAQIRAAQATRTAAQETKSAAQATQAASRESANAGRTLGGTINVVAEFGYSLSTAIPSMRTFGVQLAMMGGTAYQMGASFGVVGAAVGAVVGLLPSAISMFSKVEESAANAADAVRQLGEEIARQDEVQQRQAGTAEVGDIEANIEEIRNELRGLTGELEQRSSVIRRAAEEAIAAQAEFARRTNRELSESEQDINNVIGMIERLGQDAGIMREDVVRVVRGQADAEREIERLSIEQLRTLHEQREQELAILESARERAQAYGDQTTQLGTQARFYQSILSDEARLRRMHTEGVERRRREQREQEEAQRRAAAAARRRAREDEQSFREMIEGLTQFSGSTELSVIAEIEEEERVSAQRAIASIRGFFAERDRIIQEEQRAVRNQGEVAAADFSAFQQIGAGLGLASGRDDPFTLALEQREDAMRAHQMALRDLERQGTEWTAEEFNRRAQLYQQALSMQRSQARAAA